MTPDLADVLTLRRQLKTWSEIAERLNSTPAQVRRALLDGISDPDSLDLCAGCLHAIEQHVVTGCTAVDDLGNRCACEATP